MKLTPDFLDHVGRRAADGAHRERREDVDEGGSDQRADEDARLGKVHDAADRLVREPLDLVQVRGEEQEGGERGAGDRVTLGQRLRGIPDGIQRIGDVADLFGGVAHLDDAAGVVRDGTECVHREDVGRRHQHTHRRDSRAEDARGDGDVGLEAVNRAAEVVGAQQCGTDDEGRESGCLEADRDTGDDVRGGPGLGRLGDALYRPVVPFGVVLGDEEEREGRDQADQAAERELPLAVGQEHAEDHEQDRRCSCCDVEAPVELVHRVLRVLLGSYGHHAEDRRDQAEGGDDQREEDPDDVAAFGVTARSMEQGDTKDHGADHFRSR